MADVINLKQDQGDDTVKRIVAQATQNARAKNARLQLMKERNQIYLASRRDEFGDDDYDDDDMPREL